MSGSTAPIHNLLPVKIGLLVEILIHFVIKFLGIFNRIPQAVRTMGLLTYQSNYATHLISFVVGLGILCTIFKTKFCFNVSMFNTFLKNLHFFLKYLYIELDKYIFFSELGICCRVIMEDARFADSNPSEVDGFFQDVKLLSTSPPGRTLSWGSRV